MKSFFQLNQILLAAFIALSGSYVYAKDIETIKYNHSHSSKKREVCKHNIQLQLADANGWPVEGTEFWVTLRIIKEGSKVTILFPLINFATGQVSKNDPYYPSGQVVPGIPPSGGYLFTADGFLPEKFRHNDVSPRSVVAASNNGLSPVFSFTELPLPTPPAGYIVSVTNAGAITVQCAGTFGNIIPAGPQILMPCDLTYLAECKQKLCKNYIIDDGFTDTTQYTNPRAVFDGIRDTHVNDAFDGIVAFAWGSNANIPDKTNNALDTYAAIGKVVDGKLEIGQPIQLSSFGPGFQTFDTAVTINRADKYNIIVSYGVINHNVSPQTSARYRAVIEHLLIMATHGQLPPMVSLIF